MAKRNNGPTRADGAAAAYASGGMSTDAIERRVVAFAEQLGRIVGTIQARAEGWMDRETLNQQLTGVRDGAARLLEQLAGTATTATKKTPATAVRGGNKGRSGGGVDAPGKKHRRKAPADPGATIAASQASKMRTARTMEKTNRHRGRG